MDCGVTRQQLEHFLAGSLEPGDMEFLADHLGNCERCAQLLLSFSQANGPPAPCPADDAATAIDLEVQRLIAKCKERALDDPEPSFPEQGSVEAPLGRLGKYKIVRAIDRGSYGFVYEVFDADLGAPRALKVLKPRVADIPGVSEQFMKEATSAANVEHEHVVVVHEALKGTAEFPLPAFVMQLVSGGSLVQALQRAGGKFDPRKAARYARQAAAGLAHAHGRGLVHRDIKPRNLLLDGVNDNVKIADFGIARAYAVRRPQGGSIQGTPAYMSPEQLNDPDKVGPESDVYNLGASLYELVIGRAPFESDRFDGQPPLPPVPPRKRNPNVLRDLESIILKCLQTDPKNRYTAAALEAELGRFLNDEPVEARSHSTWELLVLWRRRAPRAAAFAALFLLSLVAGLIVSSVLAFLFARSANEARYQTGEARRNAERSDETARLLQEDTNALSRTGVFAVMAGQRDEAKTFFDTAIRVRERLVQLSDKPEHRHDLALARMHLGNWHLMGGRYEEAIAAYERSQPMLSELVEAHPADARYRFQLANTLDNHGMALLNLQRPEQAEAVHRRALAERQRLAASAGAADPMARAWRASTFNHLGNARKMHGAAEAAEQAYNESRKILAKLADDFPDVPSHRQELAYVYVNLSGLHLAAGKLDEAEKLLRLAVARQQRLYQAPNRLPDYGAELSAGLVGLGDVERRRKAPVKALAWYDQALGPAKWALDRAPDYPKGKQYLAEALAGRSLCLLALGRTDEASRAVAECSAAAEGGTPPEAVVKVAAALAVASASANVKPAQREQFRDQALKLLQSIQKQGHFKLAAQAAELDHEDFNSLRGDAVFRGLR